jgi:hypothetical protein
MVCRDDVPIVTRRLILAAFIVACAIFAADNRAVARVSQAATDGWRKLDDGYWEYWNNRSVWSVFTANSNIDPENAFAWGLEFNENGVIDKWSEWRYNGMDNAGIFIEHESGPGNDGCAQAYAHSLSGSTTRVIPAIISIACLEMRTQSQTRAFHLPRPPTTLVVDVNLQQLRLTLRLGVDNRLLVSVQPLSTVTQ